MAYGDDRDNPDWDPITKKWRPEFLSELVTTTKDFCAEADRVLSILKQESDEREARDDDR